MTFGYVVGYVLIALIAGRAATVWSRHSGSTAARVATGVALMLLASASVYIPGLIWLKVATGVLMFEGGLVYVQGPMKQEAEQSARALAGLLEAALRPPHTPHGDRTRCA